MDAGTRLRALFEAHVVAVRRYARHRGVRGADADDPRPWLLAVARNVGRNQARSARRYAATLVEVTPDEVTETEPAEVTASVRFSGLGDPVSVEAPTEYEDVDLAAGTGTGG